MFAVEARRLKAAYPLSALGARIRTRRGGRSLREMAKDIGISAATLSRIESGHRPDLETFRRVCVCFRINPTEVLGLSKREALSQPTTLSQDSVQELADMILAAQRAKAYLGGNGSNGR